MANQRRIHFHKESDQRRKSILDAVVEIAPEVTIYDGSAHARRRQRDACLVQLVTDLAMSGASMLVLEQDDSVLDVAIAWSWHRGGQWGKRIEPLVMAVKVV